MSTVPKNTIAFPESRREAYLERPLPSSEDAERVVLGSIILDNSIIGMAAESLLPEEFYSPFNRRIYAAMLTLFQAQRPIDPILVGEELKKEGSLESIGGTSMITNLTFGLPHFSDIEEYITIIRDKAKVRELVRACNAIQGMALSEETTAQELFDHAEQQIFKLNHDKTKHVAEDAAGLLHNTALKYKEITEKGLQVGLSTGLADLDQILGGYRKGDLIIVGARPSMGKTSFGVQNAVSAALSEQDNYVSAIFSLEMTKEQLASRILCGEARVNSFQWQKGWVHVSGWERIAGVVSDFPLGRLYIDDEAGITPMQLRAKCRRIIAEKKRLDLVVVDYLGLMRPSVHVKNQGPVQVISAITAELKAIAKDLQVPIVALCQLSRSPEARNPPIPILSDLRDSGSIEQDADVVLFLYRESYYHKTDDNAGLADVIVAKQRNGPTDTVCTAFIKEYTRFENFIKD